MRKVPERQVSLLGQTAQFQPSGASSAVFGEVAAAAQGLAQDMQAKADAIYVSEAMTDARNNSKDIFERNFNNPAQLEKELGNYRNSMLKNTPALLRPRLDQEYSTISTQYLNKSKEIRNKELTIQERLASEKNYNSALETVGFAAKDLFSVDPTLSPDEVVTKKAAALDTLLVGLDSIEKDLTKTDARGNTRPASQIISKINSAKEYAFSQAAFSFYESAPDKLEAINQWRNDDVVLETPEGAISIRSKMDPMVADKVEKNLVTFYKQELKLLKEQRKQQEGIAEQYKDLRLTNQAISGEIALDPTSADDKNVIDRSWGQLQNQLMNQGKSTGEILDVAADLTIQTGIMPKQLKSIVASSVLNGDVAQRVEYSDYLSKIGRENPRALIGVDSKVSSMALTISKNMDAGLDPEMAVTWAQNDIDIAKKEDRQFRRSKWKDKKENERSERDLVSNLQDEPGFDLFRADPIIPDALRSEYLMLEEGFYLNENVDRDVARTQAMNKIRETWSITNIGPKRFMKYSPEAIYGNAAGTEWIGKQLSEQTGIKMGSVALEIDPDTITADKPSYFVTTINDFDAFDILLDENNQPVKFQPDFKASSEFNDMQQKISEQQVTRDEARIKIEAQREADEIFGEIYF